MSKRRRDRGASSGEEDLINHLESVDISTPAPDPSLTSLASAGYGSQVDVFPELSRQRIKVILLPIDQLSPSTTQPRRVLPNQIRQYWDGTGRFESIAQTYQKWLYEVMIERGGTKLDLAGYLLGSNTDRAPVNFEEISSATEAKLGPLESSLMQIVALAASIYRDGLTNPITVASHQSAYIIETGERRWWAYHLLNWQLQVAEWQKIPARVVEHVSLWRQASENNARSDLNAIAKARQLSLLLMALYEVEGHHFVPLSQFTHERDFYAQVADGEQWRIPRGKGEAVLNAMGLKNPVQIRQYRRLLRLPHFVWMVADDLGWSENLLRSRVLANLEDDTSIIKAALLQAYRDGYTVNDLTVYGQYLESPDIAYDGYDNPSRHVFRDDADLGGEFKWLLKNASRIRLMDKQQVHELLERIEAIRAWLDELESFTRDKGES